MRRVDAIVAGIAALWLLGAVASFWRASAASLIIAWILAIGVVVLLAVLGISRLLRR